MDRLLEAVRTADLDELAFMAWLKEQGYLLPRPLTGRPGWWAAIVPLMLHYSIQGGQIGDENSIELRYCYGDDLIEVIAAINTWDGTGDPDGWRVDKMTGRRRPDGDAEREYQRW